MLSSLRPRREAATRICRVRRSPDMSDGRASSSSPPSAHAGERVCRLGSPLYAGLLERTALDVEAGGPTWQVLEAFADWPGQSAFVLRFTGAVHRLVLSGAAPALAAHFTPGGDPDFAWPAFRAGRAARRAPLHAGSDSSCADERGRTLCRACAGDPLDFGGHGGAAARAGSGCRLGSALGRVPLGGRLGRAHVFRPACRSV